tara:strand:- start:1472 stop:1675 length:204 start_codon:yes stop_codon:yes gene_type:complete
MEKLKIRNKELQEKNEELKKEIEVLKKQEPMGYIYKRCICNMPSCEKCNRFISDGVKGVDKYCSDCI